MCRLWLFWDILFSWFVPKSSLPSAVHVMHCYIYLWYLFLIHFLCLWGTPKLSTWAFFIKAQQRQTCSVGGKQLHARHTAGCVLLAFPPFKSLFKLFSSLTAVFYYTRIFSPQFLWQGENLGGGDGGEGAVYILVWCWSLHILGQLPYLHDQPRLWRIVIKSSLLMCAAKCWHWCHSCTEDTHLCVNTQCVINVEEAKCLRSCFSPPSDSLRAAISPQYLKD